MTAINLNPSARQPYEVDQTGETTRAAGSWSGSRVKEDAGRDLARNRLSSSRPALAVTLENRLKAFDQALSRFSWPTDLNSISQARLIAPTDRVTAGNQAGTGADPTTLHYASYLSTPGLPPARLVTPVDNATAESQEASSATDQGETPSLFYRTGALTPAVPTPTWTAPPQLSAEIIPTDQARPYTLSYSTGFSPDQATSLAPGDYTVNLALHEDGNIRRDTVRVAVESGDTNADVLARTAAALNGSELPVQARVVDQDSPGQAEPGVSSRGTVLLIDLNAARSTGDLTLWDGQGTLGASLGLRSPSRASGSAATGTTSMAVSRAYAPTAFRSDSQDPGAATTLAPGTYALTVAMGDASRDVEVEVHAGDTWKDVLATTARAISATGLATAGVQDVSRRSDLVTNPDYYPLAEGAAIRGQAVDPKIGERLAVTGGAMTLDASGNSASGPDNLLTALNLTVSEPGSDAVARVDGRTQVRAPGVFQLDQGRVEATAMDQTGGTLPLTVTSALDRLSTAMSDVATSYNDLRSFLLSNQDLLRQEPDVPAMAERLREPLTTNQAALSAMGLSEWGARKLLGVDSDKFLASALADPAGTRTALEGDAGLLTSWRAFTAGMRSKDLDGLVVEESRLENAYLPSPRAEAALERTHRLVDLLG